MVSASAAFGFAYLYLCLAFAALELSTFLDSQCGAVTGTTTCAEAPLFHSAAEVLPPLAAVVVLFVAVALTYRHLSHRHAYAVPVAGAGNGRRSISGSGLVMFVLCVSAGTLEFIVFGGQAAGGGADHGALGLAALRALPAAATGTFFIGMMLIIVAHVRPGGEGGGGAVAADGQIQGLLRLLAKVAAGAAAALVVLMAMALTLHGAKY
ncbi:unnamed protein product [Miscanthus lutarioriparius]|uniref:Uncharacterized protein n=1 Tax=Miscanthus lutarioriparius TaxID=422564 RepID=A0A811SBA2_9POAL|nr:unnamed protein product [Miscanthus lutarioriparius]